MVGPLAMAAVLAERAGGYRFAFATLAIPAVVMLCLLVMARLLYPRPEEMESHAPEIGVRRLPRVFWLYLVGAMLVAAGFADFPLIAYHFAKASVVSSAAVPILYAVAMGVSGAGSLLFGRLFDRAGLGIIVPLTLGSALSHRSSSSGDTGWRWWAWPSGASVWASTSRSCRPPSRRWSRRSDARPRSASLPQRTVGRGLSAAPQSVALYGVSLVAVVILSVGAQLAAVPLLIRVARRLRAPAELERRSFADHQTLPSHRGLPCHAVARSAAIAPTMGGSTSASPWRRPMDSSRASLSSEAASLGSARNTSSRSCSSMRDTTSNTWSNCLTTTSRPSSSRTSRSTAASVVSRAATRPPGSE